MSALLNFDQKIYLEDCPNCGTIFGMTAALQARKRQDKSTFYCPNGHSLHYLGETDADKVRKEMQQKLDAAERTRDWALDQERKSAKASREARKKLRDQTKRVEAGVCTHCNRTFQQLSRHMKCKHAEELCDAK